MRWWGAHPLTELFPRGFQPSLHQAHGAPIKLCARSLCLCFVLHAPRTPSMLLQACGPLGLLPNCDLCTKLTLNVHIQ